MNSQPTPLPHPATPSSVKNYSAISYRKPVNHAYHSMTTPTPPNR